MATIRKARLFDTKGNISDTSNRGKGILKMMDILHRELLKENGTIMDGYRVWSSTQVLPYSYMHFYALYRKFYGIYVSGDHRIFTLLDKANMSYEEATFFVKKIGNLKLVA